MNKIRSASKFVHRHKTAIAVLGTAITATYLHIKVIENVNEKLEEMGLIDEFYNMNEED